MSMDDENRAIERAAEAHYSIKCAKLQSENEALKKQVEELKYFQRIEHSQQEGLIIQRDNERVIHKQEIEALRKEVQTMAQLLREGAEIMTELNGRRCEGCKLQQRCGQAVEMRGYRYGEPVDYCSLWRKE